MDVLNVRDQKLYAKLERDQCVEARTKYLARIASEIRLISSATASTYLREANMIRHTEYGVSGSMFSKSTICERCGTFWTPQEVAVRTARRKLISKGRLARLRRKQSIRPWMLTRFQRRQLKQQERYTKSPTRLEFTCRICNHVVHFEVISQSSSEAAPHTPQETDQSAAIAVSANSKRKRKRKLLQLVDDIKDTPKSDSTLQSFLSTL